MIRVVPVMKASVWLWLAATGLLAIGLIVGFSPLKANAHDCGNAFHGTEVPIGLHTMPVIAGPGPCESARSSREIATWVPLGLAAVAGIGATVARRRGVAS